MASTADDPDFDDLATMKMEWEPAVTAENIQHYNAKSAASDKAWMNAVLATLALTPQAMMTFLKSEEDPLDFLNGIVSYKERLETQVELVTSAVARLLIAAHHYAAETEAAAPAPE